MLFAVVVLFFDRDRSGKEATGAFNCVKTMAKHYWDWLTSIPMKEVFSKAREMMMTRMGSDEDRTRIPQTTRARPLVPPTPTPGGPTDGDDEMHFNMLRKALSHVKDSAMHHMKAWKSMASVVDAACLISGEYHTFRYPN